jgi:hypothetical protein
MESVPNDRDLEFEGEDEQNYDSDGNIICENENNGSSNRDTTEIADTSTIATSLSRRRSQTSTLLQETSDAALLALASEGPAAKRTRTLGGSASPALSSDNNDVDENTAVSSSSSSVQEVAAHVVNVASAADLDYSSDVLPKSKVKATQESSSVLEIVKLAIHRDVGGGDQYKSLCENLFTMLSCLVVERVVTSGLQLNKDGQLALYHQHVHARQLPARNCIRGGPDRLHP